jgi:hypothetical protein
MRCGFTIPVKAEHPCGTDNAGKLKGDFHLNLRGGLHGEVVLVAWARPTCSERVLACYAVQTKWGDRVSPFPFEE